MWVYSPNFIHTACSLTGLWRNTPVTGTGCWGREGGTRAGTDHRVRVGTTRFTCTAFVLVLTLAPRGDGDAGLRLELQGHMRRAPLPYHPTTISQGGPSMEMFLYLELCTSQSLVPAIRRSRGCPLLPRWPPGPSGGMSWVRRATPAPRGAQSEVETYTSSRPQTVQCSVLDSLGPTG